MLCSMTESWERFGGTCCLHHQCIRGSHHEKQWQRQRKKERRRGCKRSNGRQWIKNRSPTFQEKRGDKKNILTRKRCDRKILRRKFKGKVGGTWCGWRGYRGTNWSSLEAFSARRCEGNNTQPRERFQISCIRSQWIWRLIGGTMPLRTIKPLFNYNIYVTRDLVSLNTLNIIHPLGF
jgi:hypothetical protein